jgi:hypothetical protein
VETVQLKEYGPWKNKQLTQYPFISEIAYPKVNTTNPTNELWVADLSGSSALKYRVQRPPSLKGEETHFSRVVFAADSKHIAVQWFNR